MVTIEIDGKQYKVEPGKMLIEVADENHVLIPRFCYHKKLSIAANCRMCLVEVEKAPKPLPACATPVTDGMKVFTRSKYAMDAQKAVMEFLLINHPLDCPICDQGGECELQDVAMGYGSDVSKYTEGKRSVDDEDLGPLIATDMTRCIHCTRCVRFGEEVAGIRELGATGRGEDMRIGTYIKHSMTSEISGNIIDLCPVGALTSKPFRFKARAWELRQAESIAPHDCLGSPIYVHTLRNNVMRIVPKENEAINETWISDRDRFSYVGLQHADRVTTPRIKIKGEWRGTDWQTALNAAVKGLKNTREHQGADHIAAIVSPSATLEEHYLLQKLMRHLGCHNIDHRLREVDVRDQIHTGLYPSLACQPAELDDQHAFLLIGANVQREQPLIGQRIRKATLRDARVYSLNCFDYDFNFTQTAKHIVAPNELVLYLAALVKAAATQLNQKVPAELEKLLQQVSVDGDASTWIDALAQVENKIILLGATALHHPQAASIRSLAQQLGAWLGARVGFLTDGANSAGAWLAGAIPHREAGGKPVENPGLAVKDAFEKAMRAYVLFQVEPEYDVANSGQALKSLAEADLVIACTAFTTTSLLKYADIILPIAAFAETSGTFVNGCGEWQSFQACVAPRGETRPGWKVLRVLSNLFDVPDCAYQSSLEVRDAVKAVVEQAEHMEPRGYFYPDTLLQPSGNDLQRITEWALYSVDPLVRRATALQQCAAQDADLMRLNHQLAQKLQLEDGQSVTAIQDEWQASLTVAIDDRVPDHCVWTVAGMASTMGLGNAFGKIILK